MSFVIEKKISGKFHVLSIYNPWDSAVKALFSRTDPVLCATKGIALAVLLDLGDSEAGYRRATAEEEAIQIDHKVYSMKEEKPESET